ncbi:MAG TPA: hypothetical protein VM096_10870 [Vicinamibacterales bacterium]|nr:hypothetical protein [Vicinamibacterales bacterium]
MKPFILPGTIAGALVAPAATFYTLNGFLSPEPASISALLLMLAIGIAAMFAAGRVRVFWGVVAALLYFPVAYILVFAASLAASGGDLP